MGSSRLLKEIFVAEATLEFPDGEVEGMIRMIASAARNGRIPKNAPEEWPILRSSDRPASAKPAATKPKTRDSGSPSTKPSPASISEPSKRTGRVVPATNRFKQGQSVPSSETEPEVKKKPTQSGPGILKRAASAITGKDPETGLPKAKSANVKVRGGGKASLPDLTKFFPDKPSGDAARVKSNQDSDDPLAAFPNKEPEPDRDIPSDDGDSGYVSPFARIPGLSGGDEEDDSDPKIAAVKQGLKKAKTGAGPSTAGKKYPEADVWDKFSGRDGSPTSSKEQQGRLSRLFKGRRDDDI